MGNRKSKESKNIVQPKAPNLPPVVERPFSKRSSRQSRQSTAVSSPQAAVPRQAPSSFSQVSIKKSITSLRNGIEPHTPNRRLDNNTPTGSDDIPLPPIDNSNNKSSPHTSTRASFTAPPLPTTNRLRSDSKLSSESSQHSHRKSLSILHGEIGRCSHCPHCRRTKTRNNSSVVTQQPRWITQKAGPGQFQIAMDEYDVEAVKKKIIHENGHLPGSYDYRPYLTIEQLDNYDQIKENYYTQPLVATTKPRISATFTPFPDHDLLLRREQRLNKPYTLSLFDD